MCSFFRDHISPISKRYGPLLASISSGLLMDGMPDEVDHSMVR